MKIVMEGNKPIVCTDLIDWYRVAQKFENPNIDEWKGDSTLNGLTVNQFIDKYNLVVWSWNILENGFLKSN